MAEPTDDKVKKIYTALSQGGNNLGTEEQFRAALGDEGKRKKIFDALSAKNNLGTYEQFSGAVSSVPSPKQVPQQTMKVPSPSMMSGIQQGMSGAGELIPSQIPISPETSTSQLVGSTSGSETSPLGTTELPEFSKYNRDGIGTVSPVPMNLFDSKSAIHEMNIAGGGYVAGRLSNPNFSLEPKPENWWDQAIADRKKEDFEKRMGIGDFEPTGGEKVLMDFKKKIKNDKEERQRIVSEKEDSFTVNPQTGESIYTSTPTENAFSKMSLRDIAEQYRSMIVEANPSNHQIGSGFVATDRYIVLPTSRGMNFWTESKMMNDQIGEKNIEQMQILGTSDHGKIEFPSEMRKVLADYEATIKANDPEKFKEYSELTRLGGKTLPYKEVYNYDQEKNIWYVDPKYSHLKGFISSSDKEKGVKFNGPTDVKQVEYLMGAIDNQAKMITADYMAQTGGGKNNVEYEDGTTALDRYKIAMQELESVNNYIENESSFSEKIQNARASEQKRKDKQELADKNYADRYSRDPIGTTIAYSVSEVGRGLMSIPRTVFSIPAMVGIEIPELQATANRFKKDEEKFLPKPTELQKSILERPLNIITTGTEMIADMYVMGNMGMGLGGSRPAMFASSYINTYNDYYDATYDRLIKEGIPAEKAREASSANAFWGAGLTATVESFGSGMEKLIAGGVKKEATESLIKSLAKGEGIKQSIEKATKTYLTEVPKEQLEELINLFTDKMVNARTNYDMGHEYLDADISAGEIGETLIMTGVIGGFGALRDFKTPNGLQRSALYEALNDPKNFQEKVSVAIEKGMITKEEAKNMNDDIEELMSVVSGLPDGLDIDDKKGMDLIMNLYKKKQIKEADKGAYVDEKFASEKEQKTNEKITEIDAEIDEIVKPEVKEGKTRDTAFVNDISGETGTYKTGKELVPQSTIVTEIPEENAIDVTEVFEQKPILDKPEFKDEASRQKFAEDNQEKIITETVSVADIIPTQTKLDKTETGGKGKPLLVRTDEGLFALDGHHKLAEQVSADVLLVEENDGGNSVEQAREKLKEKYGVYLGGEFENHHIVNWNNKTDKWEIVSQSAKYNEDKGYREFETKTIKSSDAKSREDAVKELDAYAKEKELTLYDGSHSLSTEATAFTKENREKFDAELKAVEQSIKEKPKAEQVNSGNKEVEADIIDLTTKAETVTPAQEAETEKKVENRTLADKIRKAKINTKDITFEGTLGLPVAVWNGAVEIVASAAQAGVYASDAIKQGIDYIQKNYQGKFDKKKFNDKIRSLVESYGDNKRINVYHGGDIIDLTSLNENEPLYVSETESESIAYSENNEGTIFKAKIEGHKIADEDVAREVLNNMGYPDEYMLHELIDPRFEESYLGDDVVKKLFSEIEKKGYEGIRFSDSGINGDKNIDNIVIINPKATLLNSEFNTYKVVDQYEAEKLFKEGYRPVVDGVIIKDITQHELDDLFESNETIRMTLNTEEKNNKFKKIANSIRQGKIDKNINMAGIPFMKEIWNTAIETVAKAVEISGDIASAVQKGVDYMKDTTWFKNLTKDEKKRAEKRFREEFNNLEEEPAKSSKKEPKTEKAEEEGKQRKFAGQVINDSEVRPEVKEAMKEKSYDSIPNDITIAEADQFIKDNSIEEVSKAILDMDNNMPFRVRAVVGMQLIKQLNDKGYKEKDVDKKNEYYDQAAEIADSLAKKGTEMGQGIQAFSLWSATTVEGIIRTSQRAVNGSKKNVDKETKGTRAAVKKNYNKAVKKSADEAVKNATQKSTSKIKTFGMTKSDIKSKKESALEKFKKATKGGSLTSGGLNKEAIEAAGEYGYYLFVDGVRKFKEWAASMKKATGLDNDTLNDIWNGKVVNNGKTLAELASANELSDIVFSHYTNPGKTTLAEKVEKELGLEEAEAKVVADEIEAEYKKISEKEIAKQLGRDLPPGTRKTRKAINKLKKAEEPLTDEVIKEAFYDSYGIKDAKDIPAETMDEIMELDKQRQAAPQNSFLRNNITVQILGKMTQATGIPWSDVVWGMWYANVLSGQETQLLNMTSNVQNLALEFSVSAIEQGIIQRDLRSVWEGFKSIISGLTKGLTEAQAIFTEGMSAANADAMNLEAKPALESVKIGTLHKYVPRFMAAIDAIGYTGAQNMMAYEVARDMAKEEGLKGEELNERANELAGRDQQQYNDAAIQAQSDVDAVYDAQGKKKEGYAYRRDVRRRRNEILFQSMPADVQEKSMNFGRFATYNYTPKGWIGAVAQALTGLNRLIPPFRLVVPFIRVVANVLNQQLDYSPYGYLRAKGWNASSWTEKLGAGTSTRQNETSKERNREYIKATTGTALMVSLYMLAAMHDDEEDPAFDVTGKGPADFNKKNQLIAQGWKPYSVKVGNKYISYQYSPIGFGLSFVGNWRDNEKFQDLASKNYFIKSVYAMKSSASGVMDMSFLTGMAGFMEALTSVADAEKAVDNFMKATVRTGTSFVIPNAFKQSDNIYRDNTVYNTTDLTSYILADIPVVRSFSGLKPKLNNLGEPIQKDASTFRRFISTKNESQAWKLLADKRIFIPGTKPGAKDFKGEPMSEEEFYTFVQRSGTATKEFLIENEEKIRGMDNSDAQEYVSKKVAKIRKKTKMQMYREEKSEDSTDFDFDIE